MMLPLFLFLCTTVISEVCSVLPVEMPMNIEDGNWLIKAKLEGSNLQVNIVEYIKVTNGTIRGRIDFKIKDADVSIFYANTNQYHRLIFKDNYCSNTKYENNDWNHDLKYVYESVLNHLLLVGPSVLFRIAGSTHIWKASENKVIRGVKVHAAKLKLNENLNVLCYFKDNNYETGIKQPNRVLFEAYDPRYYEPYRSRFTPSDHYQYWFDIYTNTRVEQNFDTIVTPKPTAYCRRPFIDSLGLTHEPFPKITEHSIHFISKTKSFDAGPSKRDEVYADEKYQILNIKSLTHGDDNKSITTETIYDYSLGLEYELTDEGKCLISPMDRSAPGLVQDSSLLYGNYKLDLNRLLNFDLNYRYFGPVLFEERNGIGTHAWQISEDNVQVEKNTHRYVVTTQYLNKLTDISSGYTLVGTKINAYDTNHKLSASLTTEYFSYGHEISSSESMRKLNAQNCYIDPKSRKTIAMYCTCKDVPCDYFDQYYYQFQKEVEESLINTGKVAASRIANIVPIFNSDEIIIYVTILDFPRIKNAFKMRNMKLDEKTLTTPSKVIISGDEEDCLMQNSYKYEPFESIAFCKTKDGNVCQRIDGKNVKLVENEINGTSCSIFMTPLKNLFRYRQELPLENIHESLNHIDIKISLTSPQNDKMFTFIPYHVVDVTKVDDDEYGSLFDSILKNVTLVKDGVKTILAIGATDSSSCYRKCTNSAENICNSFSFCVYNDRVECLVSSVENFSFDTIFNNASCTTYLLNHLSKFKEISSKKFHDIQKSVSFDSSLGKCASLCHNSDACKSFQFCSGSCSVAGYYTDAASDYSEDCNIYIPKVMDRFELTGKLIVEDVFHTEMNLNADQCAALCHDWNDKDVICQSFNYCPGHAKNLSQCQLSKYYYSSHRDDVKLVHSDTCQNYERIKQSSIDQRNSNVITRSTHIGTIFGSIVLFMATGLILGVIVVIAFRLYYGNNDLSESYKRHTFSWNKQVNDENEL